MEPVLQYACSCGGGGAHTHACNLSTCLRRGIYPGLPPCCTAAPCDAAAPAGPGPTSLADAIEGALLGMLLGDALAAPLHWLYTWPETQAVNREHFGGGLSGFAATPPGARHADSWKYFSRCTPTAFPVPALFSTPEGAAAASAAWATPGAFYHATLPAGDNTLTARLVTRLVQHLGARGGLCMDAWFATGYAPLLQRSGGAQGAHADLWVDEAHRVLFANLAAGALPWEGGMDDLCLTGINLALPLLLAYACDRDAAELAVRCLLQLTHKNEDMVLQCMWWGDLLRALLPQPAQPAQPQPSVQAALAAIFSSFSPLHLPELLAQASLTPERAYHGDAQHRPIFSSR